MSQPTGKKSTPTWAAKSLIALDSVKTRNGERPPDAATDAWRPSFNRIQSDAVVRSIAIKTQNQLHIFKPAPKASVDGAQ